MDTPLIYLQAKSGQDLLRALRHKFGSAGSDDLENDPDAFSWDRLSRAVKDFFFTAPGAQQDSRVCAASTWLTY